VNVESPGRKGKGVKRITGSEFYARDGCYPQVLLIESAAQLSGIVRGEVRAGVLAGMRDMIFQPGAMIRGSVELESELTEARGNLATFSVRAFSGDRLLMEGVIYLAMA